MWHVLVVHYKYSFFLDSTILIHPIMKSLRLEKTESLHTFFSLLCFFSISPLLYFENLLLKDNRSDFKKGKKYRNNSKKKEEKIVLNESLYRKIHMPFPTFLGCTESKL